MNTKLIAKPQKSNKIWNIIRFRKPKYDTAGHLNYKGTRYEIVKINRRSLDLFIDKFQSLENSQEEQSLRGLYNDTRYHDNSLCIYNRKKRELVGQIATRSPFMIGGKLSISPRFLIVNPEYAGQSFSKILRLALVEFNAKKHPEVEQYEIIPQITSYYWIEKFLYIMDPGLKKEVFENYASLTLDVSRTLSRLNELYKKYGIDIQWSGT